MKSYLAGLVLLALPCVLPVLAQEKQSFTINTSTPEGQLLQSLGQETDDARKISISQDFLAKYPKNEAAGWVASQLESALLAQKDYDKVLEVADMAYANGPDMDAAYYALKAAVAKGDIPAAKTWSARTSEAAQKVVASDKAPADDDAKHQLEYAKEVDEYSEYGLYVLALKAQPKEVVDLVDEMIKQDPRSQYLPLISGNYFADLEKAGEGSKACPAAERMSAGASKNAEAMIFSADCSMRAQKGAGMITYGDKALEAINGRTKEEGMSDAEWANVKERHHRQGPLVRRRGLQPGRQVWSSQQVATRRPADAQRERTASWNVPVLSGTGQLQLGKSDRRPRPDPPRLAILPAVSRDQQSDAGSGIAQRQVSAQRTGRQIAARPNTGHACYFYRCSSRGRSHGVSEQLREMPYLDLARTQG